MPQSEDPRFQGASPTPCEVDGDCPASLVCYQRTLSWTNNQSFCLCSTWYGWTLSSPESVDCDLAPIAVVSIVFFAVMALVLFHRLIILLFAMRVLNSKEAIRKNSAFTFASIFTLGWILSAIIRSCLLAKEFASPEIQTLMPFGPEWKYSPIGFYQTRPLLVVTTMFGMLTDYQLIMVWFNVAMKSSKVSRGVDQNGARRYQQLIRAAVICLEASFIVGASIIIAQDNMSNFLYFCIAFFILVLIGYAGAGIRLHSLLTEAMEKQPARRDDNVAKLKKVAWMIRFTATANAVLVLLSIAASVTVAETNKVFKEMGFIPAGFHNLGVFLIVCQIWVVTNYLFSAMVPIPRISDSSSKTSVPNATTPIISKLKELWHKSLSHANNTNNQHQHPPQCDAPRKVDQAAALMSSSLPVNSPPKPSTSPRFDELVYA